MDNLGIVILNYLNYKDTVECIISLQKQTKQDLPIVIVDNNSNNDSYSKLKQYIQDKDNVYLIEAKKNLGFAKGNNLGIIFLKKYFSIDNILICNNDLIFENKTYLEDLLKIDIKDNIGAIGTSIIGRRNENQNPANWPYSRQDIINEIHKYNVELGETKNNKLRKDKLPYIYIYSFLKRIRDTVISIRNLIRNRRNIRDKSIILDKKEYLHGAAFVLTKNYFKKFPLLYPKTFLYGEEKILKILFNMSGLSMMYVPSLTIIHKEDKSSELSFSNINKIGQKYRADSNKIILDIYNKDLEQIILSFGDEINE